jgi:glycerophosphoryl diester phosphodiesterase
MIAKGLGGMSLAIMGRAFHHPKRGIPADFGSSALIAHRGLHLDCPENSLAAFTAADAKRISFKLDVLAWTMQSDDDVRQGIARGIDHAISDVLPAGIA